MPWYVGLNYSSGFYWFIFLTAIWQIPWKGVALWRAAKRDHKTWFIVFLVVNTLAVLEILYIFVWSKSSCKDCWCTRWWNKIFHRQ